MCYWSARKAADFIYKNNLLSWLVEIKAVSKLWGMTEHIDAIDITLLG